MQFTKTWGDLGKFTDSCLPVQDQIKAQHVPKSLKSVFSTENGINPKYKPIG